METISNRLQYRRLKIKLLLDEISAFFGIIPVYSDREIYELWKKSGLTYYEVADHFCRSIERAKSYCYGRNCSKVQKSEIASYFKIVIYKKLSNA